jgi:hypothetical protein
VVPNVVRPSREIEDTESDLSRLFHRLNNQLGVILANAELLESRLPEGPHRARAAEVVSGVLNALDATQQIRTAMEPDGDRRPKKSR